MRTVMTMLPYVLGILYDFAGRLVGAANRRTALAYCGTDVVWRERCCWRRSLAGHHTALTAGFFILAAGTSQALSAGVLDDAVELSGKVGGGDRGGIDQFVREFGRICRAVCVWLVANIHGTLAGGVVCVERLFAGSRVAGVGDWEPESTGKS